MTVDHAIYFGLGWIGARYVDPLLTRLWRRVFDGRR
jgi:hypothetical protein